ncbi:unnamed protein product [Orchesella dallaii]|uniref:Headcase protein n=1 Tax=Orchesella dallaii TaxID=48710 RepID=A0ABP1R147_9HEXA
MAPKGKARHDHAQNNGGNVAVAGAAGGQNPNPNGNRNNGNRNHNGHHHGMASPPMKCVRPQGCLEPSTRLIYKEDIDSGDLDVVRVTCNNLECTVGNYMHLECFNDWEKTVLGFLSSTGRARSWNVRQRIQNLWTKKGYDLAFKACDCVCGKGHLRKDLDWISPAEKMKFNRNQNNVARPAANAGNGAAAAGGGAAANANNANGNNNQGNGNANNNAAAAAQGEAVQPQPAEVAQQNGAAGGAGKKKKKGKSKEQRPSLALSAPIPHPNDNHKKKELQPSSSTDSGTHSWTGSSCSYNDVASCVGLNRPRVNSLSSNASGSSATFSGNSCSPPSPGAIGPTMFRFQRKNSKGLDILGERTRNNSEGSMFAKRADMRVFNVLNRVKLNNVNIKIDTLGDKSDDIRQFILSTLQQYRMSKVQCCVCKDWMQVYDRCPLIDGTFFMSPRQHHQDSIRVSTPDSHPKFLNAVCMYCCTGLKSALCCRWCRVEWSGIDLVIGSCYNYDIFAATICCTERRQCCNCRATLNRPNFFSEASALSRCDVCGMIDFHLVHPVKEIFDIYALRC